jgi:protein-tyrosine phosphatase
MVAVLFVCMGNICRSPTAEGVFRHACEAARIGDRVHIDSAGTGAWHVGEPPDRRAQRAALARGIDLSAQRARKVAADDFRRFDLIVAMDEDNLGALSRACPDDCLPRLALFLDYAPQLGVREVPDPYYGGGDGFEIVLDLAQAASEGLLAEVQRRLDAS